MIQKLTITKLFEKQQVSTRTNKPFTSLSLLTTEYGSRYLSGFGSKESSSWKIGDVVEVDVTESEKLDKNGKPYLNWSLIKKPDEMASIKATLAKHERLINEIVEHIKMKEDDGRNSDGSLPPNFDVNAELESLSEIK